jgi:hypothetical protein
MFKYDLLTYDKNTFEVKTEGFVSMYNTDSLISLSDVISNSKRPLEVCLTFDSNNVFNSQQGVYISNHPNKNNKRVIKIGPDNFQMCVEYFSARKSIPFTWENEYSEFLKPNTTNFKYQQYSFDSIIYTIFNTQNTIKSDDILKNEFFWMSKEEMMELANDTNYTELYNDARTDTDRYVHKLLFGEQNIYDQLSPDAKLVLDKATELTRMSMTMRQHFADDHNHLNSWDAGYAQLKLVWKEYFPNEFKEFRQLYKNLEDRMRPLVYELGFLLK